MRPLPRRVSIMIALCCAASQYSRHAKVFNPCHDADCDGLHSDSDAQQRTAGIVAGVARVPCRLHLAGFAPLAALRSMGSMGGMGSNPQSPRPYSQDQDVRAWGCIALRGNTPCGVAGALAPYLPAGCIPSNET